MGVVRSSGSASVRFRDRSSEKKRNPFEKRKSGVFSAHLEWYIYTYEYTYMREMRLT